MSDEEEAARYLAAHPDIGETIFQPHQDLGDDLSQVFDDLHLHDRE